MVCVIAPHSFFILRRYAADVVVGYEKRYISASAVRSVREIEGIVYGPLKRVVPTYEEEVMCDRIEKLSTLLERLGGECVVTGEQNHNPNVMAAKLASAWLTRRGSVPFIYGVATIGFAYNGYTE